MGGGDVTAKIQYLRGGTTSIRLKDNGDGTYEGGTTMQQAGNYLVLITLNGVAIHNSPFRVTVCPGATVPSSCTVSSGALYSWVAGRSAYLVITAKDALGNATGDPDLDFRVRVRHFQEVDEQVHSHGDGTYSASFSVYLGRMQHTSPSNRWRLQLNALWRSLLMANM